MPISVLAVCITHARKPKSASLFKLICSHRCNSYHLVEPKTFSTALLLGWISPSLHPSCWTPLTAGLSLAILMPCLLCFETLVQIRYAPCWLPAWRTGFDSTRFLDSRRSFTPRVIRQNTFSDFVWLWGSNEFKSQFRWELMGVLSDFKNDARCQRRATARRLLDAYVRC